MKVAKCKTKVVPDDVDGWNIEMAGNCVELVKEINKKLGPYGRKYFNRRTRYTKNENSAQQKDKSLIS